MKRKLPLLFFLHTLNGNILAQSPLANKWDSRFCGSFHDFMESFQQTADGGYLLGGRTWSDFRGDVFQNTILPKNETALFQREQSILIT